MAFVKEIVYHSMASHILLEIVVEMHVLERFGYIFVVYITRRRLNVSSLIHFFISRRQPLPFFLAGYTGSLSHEIICHFFYDRCSDFGCAGRVYFAVFEIVHNLNKNPLINVRLIVTGIVS